MPTLLIRLAAPIQSWGESARFNLRPTQQTPTKSGVLGMVCAAMGIPRSDRDRLVELNKLKFGVRTDRPGKLLIDFHTVSQVVNAEGKIPQDTTPTDRYYLADAVFLVGLEGEERQLLAEIHSALLKPHWLLFLGRKSCMPSQSPWLKDGLKDINLQAALSNYPSLLDRETRTSAKHIEIEAETGKPLMDTPLDFDRRKYAPRFVSTVLISEES